MSNTVFQQRWRLGVMFLFLSLGFGALIWQGYTRAGGPGFTPQVAAHFKGKNVLQVLLALEGTKDKVLAGTLMVELQDSAGKKLGGQNQIIRQKENLGTYDFQLSADKTQADKLNLSCQFNGQKYLVPLARVLLAKGHETTLSSGQEFHAGSPVAIRCQVQGVRSVTESVPLPGSAVTIGLKAADGKIQELFRGRTGKDGLEDVEFDIPTVESGQYTLVVTTLSAFGEEKLERPVRIKADSRILLVSDKPIYQPGQLMHLRALVLRPFDLRPVANKDLVFEVEDSKGNKVFKRTFKTSEFGVASVDFQLADEVNLGDYHIRANLGDFRADKTVTVKRYVLPKFKAEITSDKRFYLPKEKIQATLQSDYFFGKPVAHAKVQVTASTFDVESKKFQTWEGTTDANGHAKFEIQLPDYFVGQPLQKGDALVKLEVLVTDSANHSETATKNYPVSNQPIRISLIPEGGKLAPGLENRLFAAAIYPDGSPAAGCSVRSWLGKEAKGEPLAEVNTNEAGLAEFKIHPKKEQFRAGNPGPRQVEFLGGQQQGFGPQIILDVRAEAKDAKGNTASAVAELNCHPLGENILLRLDKAIYAGGDRLAIDVRSSAGLPTAFVDVVRGGQVLLSRWLDVKDGQASENLNLPPSAFGSIEIHAYQMLASGEIIRDSRVAYVQPRQDLKIYVQADQSEYAPGTEGRIRFQVTDSLGKPMASALGVVIVDEAVYSLQDSQPGLEKAYFTLQEELMKPQVQVQFSTNVDNLVRQPVVPLPQQQIAEVLLTSVKLPPPARWEVAPAQERRQHVLGKVQQVGWGLYHFAMNQGPAVVKDPATGQWGFKPGILAEAQKKGHLTPQALEGVFGDTLTLEDLGRLNKDFTPNRLAEAITQNRLQQAMYAVTSFTSQNPKLYLKGKQWVLPESIVADAFKKQGLDGRWLIDGWGNPLRLIKTEKKNSHDFHAVWDFHDVISAGSDGKFETPDDLRLTDRGRPLTGLGLHWWGLEEQNEMRLGGMPGRGGMLENDRFLFRNGELANRQLAAPGGILPQNAPAPAAMALTARDEPGADQSGQGGAASPRIREYFPETLLWSPSLITNDQGIADLAVSFADSITTWRLTASANSRTGALGGVNLPLKVFQDFFVDIDLPVHLTQNDEVAFPVAVYNYLKTPQTLKVELKAEPWFELLDTAGLVRSLDLKPNEVTSVKFRIKAQKIGTQPLTVMAYGSKKSDAVKRVVEVVPDGRKVEKVVTDRLAGKVLQVIDIPQGAVPDASKLLVRLYPGVMSQVLEGLEGMLRMPGGCFEQTSSSAYPNILVVDYIKKARLASPQLLMKAESHLNVGYQRLLTFERPGGGFDWWGREAPLVWLSAYGLQEFSDMARVYPIDRGIIDRTQAFLLKNMDKDGTWANIGATHGETIASMGNPKLLLTSYVTWSLLESGLDKKQIKKAIDFIRGNLKEANDNAYILALAANALAAYDAKDDSTLEALQQLDKLRKDLPEWKAISFPAKGTSLTYARGDSVTVETTALAALAMLKTGQFTNSINQALTYLVKVKTGEGHWGSTQATILALKALVGGLGGAQHRGVTPFVIKVNGTETARGSVNEDNSDLLQAFDLKGIKPGPNQVEIEVQGETALLYQIVGRHFEPWKESPKAAKPVFDVQVTYDRTKLSTNDLLRAKATLKYQGEIPTSMVMLDLGIAPGFTVDAGDFAEMVDKKQIKKFSVTQRQVILYLGDIRPGETLTFEYTLKPKYPIRAQTPPSVAYEYYTPANRAVSRPVELTVEERK